MGDLYLNELSVDFTVSKQPLNEQEAKEFLLQLIQTYFAYKVSTGLERVYVLSKERLAIKEIGEVFGTGVFFKLLNELEEALEISEIEKNLFKAAISETFKPDWNPEYLYSDYIAYGLGEACRNDVYSISFLTELIDNTDTWDRSMIPIKERKLTAINLLAEIPTVCKHISTIKHIVVDHEIWEKCSYINKTSLLLPKKGHTEFVVKAISSYNWEDFYANQQRIDVTPKKKIGRVVARINGWQECLTTDNRLTFNAKKRYIAVDTQHAAFEVYTGVDVHKGEMKFNDDIIDTSKADASRRVNLR